MNRDEIIAMAREAGFRTGKINLSNGPPVPFIAPASGTSCMVELDRFAALVAAKEREACAQVCEDIEDEYRRNEGGKYPELKSDAQTGASDCAAAIRARSSHGQPPRPHAPR